MIPGRALRPRFSKQLASLNLLQGRYRYVSTTNNAKSSVADASSATASNVNVMQYDRLPHMPRPESPLAQLPLSNVLRSLLILSISSSPLLLRPCIYALSALAHPRTAITDVARNPALNWLVKHTLYKQFNAGENKREVQRSIEEIKQLGYRGVLLGYAREVLVGDSTTSPQDEKAARKEVEKWLQGTLQTVDMATESDIVALK